MAIVRPLYNDAGDLREMSDSQISELVEHTKNLFISNPSVYLRVVGSDGDLGSIADTRYKAGAATSDSTNHDTEKETPNIELVTVNYSKVDQELEDTAAPSDTDNYRFPLYYATSGDNEVNLKAMSLQDIYDTIAAPAIEDLDGNGQLYTISTSDSVSGYTLLGSIFSDTGADTSKYTKGGIPEAVDQPLTRNTYYLHQKNPGTQSYTFPVRYSGGESDEIDIQEMDSAEVDLILDAAVRHLARSVVASRLRFSWDGAGTDTGVVLNTRLNGTGNYQKRQVGDDYRSQEFPNGTFVTENTYKLRVRKV